MFKNEHKPHEPGTQFVPWLDTYKPWLKRLQRDFVITTADKLANNYVVVCKKHYIQRLLEDLSSGQFYAEVTSAANQPDALSTVAQALLSKVRDQSHGAVDMYHSCANDEDLLKK